MTDQEILSLAAAEGFSAAFLEPAFIPLRPEYRKSCEENRCGNYDANYSCPPACGTAEEMRQRLLGEEKALVLTTAWPIESYRDAEGIRAGTESHNRATLRLLTKLREAGYEGFAVGGSCCDLCRPCKRKSGEPCAHPELRFSCMSAYCVDVAKTAELCGLPFSWDEKMLHPYGMLLFRKK